MAKEPAEADSAQDQATQFRETLQNAYSFVEGQKITQSFSALTPEDCFDAYIERVSGADTAARPNVINRIAKVKNETLAAIQQIKTMPPDSFRNPDPAQDTNTSR